MSEIGVTSQSPSKMANEKVIDMLSSQQANLFHQRRIQTDYLVSFEDLEPVVSDMIKEGSIKASRNLDAIAEMQKELVEHKNYVERMTNNKDLPFLDPVKALVNEQITTMYSFMSEIKAESKA